MIDVLVVDDSVVVRRLVSDALRDVPGLRVVGSAPNGRIALAKVALLRPQIVILDVEMPDLGGLDTLRELQLRHPSVPVIMFSTGSASGVNSTLDALAAGARDYVLKPSNIRSVAESISMVREQLVPRIRALHSAPAAAVAPRAEPARRRPGRFDIVAIGCSTGGPEALTRVLGALPANLGIPVLVVQHMPPTFTKLFADRLNRTIELTVVEATADLRLQEGTVYLAPGDRHLEVVRAGADVVTRLSDGPPEHFCRPAVDVLFRSVARVFGGATLAVVLTGMGQDGRRGAAELRAAGAEIVAQDEATSVVWGMPGAVVGAGLADAVLPLDSVADYLLGRVTAGRVSR